jgi:putative flippase GtrA
MTRKNVRGFLRPSATFLTAIGGGVGQLGQFCAVGAAGLALNLVLCAICVDDLRLLPVAASAVAFAVAVTHNYLVNRYWTFRRERSAFAGQGLRFVVVSVAALALNVLLLTGLLSLAVAKLPAQAIAVVLVTPVSFLGNKLWSFRTGETVVYVDA